MTTDQERTLYFHIVGNESEEELALPIEHGLTPEDEDDEIESSDPYPYVQYLIGNESPEEIDSLVEQGLIPEVEDACELTEAEDRELTRQAREDWLNGYKEALASLPPAPYGQGFTLAEAQAFEACRQRLTQEIAKRQPQQENDQ